MIRRQFALSIIFTVVLMVQRGSDTTTAALPADEMILAFEFNEAGL